MADSPVIRRRFETPVSRQAVAENWEQRGYDCRLFVDQPGQEWNGFTHSTNELVTVVEGRLEMRMQGVVIKLEPGDELFIPRLVEHSVRNSHSGITRWLFGYD